MGMESTAKGLVLTPSASMTFMVWLSMLKVYHGSHDIDTRRNR